MAETVADRMTVECRMMPLAVETMQSLARRNPVAAVVPFAVAGIHWHSCSSLDLIGNCDFGRIVGRIRVALALRSVGLRCRID